MANRKKVIAKWLKLDRKMHEAGAVFNEIFVRKIDYPYTEKGVKELEEAIHVFIKAVNKCKKAEKKMRALPTIRPGEDGRDDEDNMDKATGDRWE